MSKTNNNKLKIPKSSFFASSVALRTGLFSTLWVSLVLITLVSISAFFYRNANERNFEKFLQAHLYSLIGAVNLSADDKLQGLPELGDIRYNDPSSGWYWEALIIDSSAQDSSLKSPSLLGKDIAAPLETELAFDQNSIRSYRAHGLGGEDILIVETDIVMERSNPNVSNPIARFRIMGNREEVEQQLNDFWSLMHWYLAGFIFMSGVINAVMIAVGLKPLRKIQKSLLSVRTGKSTHIDLDLPAEIRPMAQELNSLIDNQRQMIERFRTQLGNLAHAMKTPLAILTNEIAALNTDKGKIILEQAQLMNEQIQHALQRAQIAALGGSLTAQTPVNPVIERTGRVISKLFPDKQVRYEKNAEPLIFAGESQDLEEIIGNVLENAGKWAHSTIWLQQQKIVLGDRKWIQIIIEDDGPGLDETKREQALKRGHRLDETVPGSGLGLSIVSELLHEYDGNLKLDRSNHGGLLVCLTLPLTKEH